MDISPEVKPKHLDRPWWLAAVQAINLATFMLANGTWAKLSDQGTQEQPTPFQPAKLALVGHSFKFSNLLLFIYHSFLCVFELFKLANERTEVKTKQTVKYYILFDYFFIDECEEL